MSYSRNRYPGMWGLLLACVVAMPAMGMAQVIPNGQTATTVQSNANGRPVVKIAPSNPGGLSYNGYTSFSVGTAGVGLDNRTVGARSILNEVTSAQRSVIRGAVEVMGSRAHVMIANPNGITVDGGSFVNTGGVVLGTSDASLVTRRPAPGLTQDNAVLETAGGDILIGPAGLSGTMTALQLYAGKIKVSGPVTVNPRVQGQAAGEINILAGKSHVEFDTAVPTIAALNNWAAVTDRGTGTREVLVDVTSSGALVASRVTVGVSENGAGVSFAGKGLASAGEFRIDGSGQVDFKGAVIKATGDVRVTGSSITVLNAPARQSRLISIAGALTVIATNGDLRNIGGLLRGSVRNTADSASQGGVTLKASGDIVLTTRQSGRTAIAFASDDDLAVDAGGNVTNTAGRLLSNANTRISAVGDFTNKTEISGGGSRRGQRSTYSSNDNDNWHSWLWDDRYTGFAIDYGNLKIPDQLAYIVGSSVTITADNVVNRGGEINANDGSVKITTGHFKNIAVLTGAAHIDTRCHLWCTGSGSSNVALNGGNINASKTIDVSSTGTVVNSGGQWLALEDINVTAASMRIQGRQIVSVVERPAGLRGLFGGTEAWSYSEDLGGSLLAPNGTIRLTTASPVIAVSGTIAAKNGIVAPAGVSWVQRPQLESPADDHEIGLLWPLIDHVFELGK